MINVYELGYEACAKAYTFRGDKNVVTPAQIQTLLQGSAQQAAGAAQGKQQQQQAAQRGASRFLMPVRAHFLPSYMQFVRQSCHAVVALVV